MSQTIMLYKLSRFLQLSNPKSTKVLSHDLNKQGFCYGFSICYATMRLLGKLNWWQAALIKLATWDENLKSLNKKANLPDALDPDETLGQVFERILNYIVFNQVCEDRKSYKNIKLDDIRQTEFLLPENKYFEVLSHDKTIKHIKSRACVSGFFSADQLSDLLCEKQLSNNIVLLHNTWHTMCIAYQKPYWLLYDPNNPHNVKLGTDLHKKFKSKKLFINEIIKSQGSSLSLEYASFDKKSNIEFPQYQKIVKESAGSILDEYGFHLIVTETPDALPSVLKSVIKSRDGNRVLADALCTIDESHWTGFHKLLWYSPEHTGLVLDCVIKSKKGPNAIAQSIAYLDPEYQYTGLYLLALKAPDMLLTALKYASLAPDGVDLISLAMAEKNDINKNESGIYSMLKYAPHHMMAVLGYLAQSTIGTNCLVAGLIAQTKNEKTAWDFLNENNLNCKIKIFKMISENLKQINADNLIFLIDKIKKEVKKSTHLTHSVFNEKRISSEKLLLNQLVEELSTRIKKSTRQLVKY